jgi:hypothetical protein
VLELHVFYSMSDGTILQTTMRAERITFQHCTDGRLLVKFAHRDGHVVTSEARSPGVGLKGLHAFTFKHCDLAYVKDVTDE